MKSEKLLLLLLLLPFALLLPSGCTKEHLEKSDPPPPLQEPTGTEKLNKFIVECTQDLYLWQSLTDWSKYANEETYRTDTDPQQLFRKFIYKDDRWSELTDDIDSWKNTLQGVSTTYGYTLIRGQFINTGHYFAIILYLTPGSPAALAGLKRGDIIVGINGGDLTRDNYAQLFSSATLTLQLGLLNSEGNISRQPDPIALTAVEMYEDPIHTALILEPDGHKIGYLCYTAYINTSEAKLQTLFGDFKSAGVTDIVLDLRYNGGGHARTAQILSSILAPAAAVKRKDTYLTRRWNDLYNQYWSATGQDLTEYFVDTLSVNMDLQRLYVLTTGNTASASEATIIGLKPYLEVILIGDTTHGKYYGGYALSVDDYYNGSPGYNKSYYQDVANWGIYLMAYRYANKNDYPTFSGGLAPAAPDDLVREDYYALKPFGDESDPLLSRALERITGKKPAQPRREASPSVKRSSYAVFPTEIRSGNPLRDHPVHISPLPPSRPK
jgi:C-terminal processing protease CtpA/Prc